MPGHKNQYVKGQVISQNKYGFVVKLANKKIGFVPNSQINHHSEDKIMINKVMSFKKIKNLKNSSQDILSLKFNQVIGFDTLRKEMPFWMAQIRGKDYDKN
ncbi:MAG: S1 RNA-binding domain-containing protein [Bacilli bacterium]|jgi:ribosomal protein S1|nr:S1 RNA-binding domain-containing protein [Bacilli bacterium]